MIFRAIESKFTNFKLVFCSANLIIKTKRNNNKFILKHNKVFNISINFISVTKFWLEVEYLLVKKIRTYKDLGGGKKFWQKLNMIKILNTSTVDNVMSEYMVIVFNHKFCYIHFIIKLHPKRLWMNKKDTSMINLIIRSMVITIKLIVLLTRMIYNVTKLKKDFFYQASLVQVKLRILKGKHLEERIWLQIKIKIYTFKTINYE